VGEPSSPQKKFRSETRTCGDLAAFTEEGPVKESKLARRYATKQLENFIERKAGYQAKRKTS